MRMEAINRTKKDLEERESRKYQMRTKLENIKTNLEVTHKIDKDKIEEDVKKQMIERVIFDKQAERQHAKTSLREQFEKELLSSAIPQIYEPKESFLLKHTDHYLGDDHIKKHTEDKPINQKP